jgi:putative FmdB family regulatory protein
MPLYDYKCKACGEKVAIVHGMEDERARKCPACGEEALVRIILATPILFNGSFPGNDIKLRKEHEQMRIDGAKQNKDAERDLKS